VNGIFEAALEIQTLFDERGWQFAIIGGVAVIRWGQPAATQDVDVCLLTGFGGEAAYLREILGRFRGRIADAEGFALENRVLLLTASNGVAIDVSLGGIPFEEAMVARASSHEFLPGVALRTCSAEDLVILKTFAGRPKDWAAVEGVLARQKALLDWQYVEEHVGALCELRDDTKSAVRLAQLRRQAEAG